MSRFANVPRMRKLVLLPAALATVFSLGFCAAAHAETPAQKEHAARLATEKARTVTLHQLHGGDVFGTVQLQQIGRTRTAVILHFTGINAPQTVITLHQGTDCNDGRYAALVPQIALNPVSSASQTSRTVVELPISKLESGNYLIDVRNATQQRQFAQACARLNY